jgi:hypothetical protein
MRARRRSTSAAVVVAALVGVVAAAVVSLGGGEGESAPTRAQPSWRGLAGAPRLPVADRQRKIVVVATPSVAQRLARAHTATEEQERSWTSQAFAAQQQVLTTLATEGVSVHPDFNYARVLDGFSASLDARAVALLDAMPEVVGVYPVRAAYPASFSERLAGSRAFDAASGRRPSPSLPGSTGRGVTVALLDTGVDGVQPSLRGRLLPGFDVVGGGDDTSARADPQDRSRVERHGTELAAILAGVDGPGGLHGVAPGASILPIRVAGWQPVAGGADGVYGRTDQLVEGLEHAVDPNGDGDAHDAVRIAVVGLAAPYASFADGPLARAVQGALDLDTLVVAPVGNDGAAGPLFGSVAGPAGAAGALAVGAVDSRTRLAQARVVVRLGLEAIYDRVQPLLGVDEPSRARVLAIAAPRAGVAGPAAFFDAAGRSLVAGRAAVTAPGADAEATVAAAAAAGASAVVLDGRALPAGGLRLSEQSRIPVVSIPAAIGARLLAARRAGVDVAVAIGAARERANPAVGQVAGFSSQGLAFDGSVKPDLVAPGVGIVTAEPGLAADATPFYGTITGTSAAAAAVGGAAALLVQLRPDLDAPALKSLLTGYAREGRRTTRAGAGTLDLGAAAVGEVASEPASLVFGTWRGATWHATRTLVLRNVSTRRLQLSLSAVADGDADAVRIAVTPNRLSLRRGRSATVRIEIGAPAAPSAAIVTGAVAAAVAGGETLRVPWALAFARPASPLLAHASLDRSSFAPSDTSPAVLSVQVGAVEPGRPAQVEPVARLDVLLYSADGRFLGVLARLRDLLPGSYSFGITGRGATSAPLVPGRYELRLAAWPVLPHGAKPSRARVPFRIE